MKKTFLALLLVVLCILSVPSLAAVEETEILYNGTFSIMEEGETLPDGWHYEAWVESGSDVYVDPVSYQGTAVVIHNFQPNDARIIQRIAVEPNTCYQFTCEVLAKDIPSGAGATISVMDTLVSSEACYETDGWVTVRLTGVTEDDQTEIVLGLRLGGYSMLSTGTAMFQNVTVKKLDTVPAHARRLALAEIPVQDEDITEEEPAREPDWLAVAMAVILCALLSVALYIAVIHKSRHGSRLAASHLEAGLLILAGAFFVRVVLSIVFVGHSTDIACFAAWADAMAEHGPGGFYTIDMFADYPPGYMYILWLFGALRSLFHLSYNSTLFILLLKLPAIAADLCSAWLVYRFALKKGIRGDRAVLLLAIAALCPVFAFVSGGWGQIDSLLTLCIVGAIVLFANDKRILAGVLYGAAILLKPQALMAGPLLAAAYLLPEKQVPYRRTLLRAAAAVIGAVLVILLFSLPFGVNMEHGWLIEKYFSTANSYPYASVEAFNLAALAGGNWTDIKEVPLLFSYGVWGIIGIVLSVVFAVALYIKERERSTMGALCLAMGVLFASLFAWGPYMHERYLFPALLLLLLAAVEYDDRRLMACFFWFSISLLFNVLCAFYIVDFPYYRDATYQALTTLGSLLTVAGHGYLMYTCVQISFRKRTVPTALYTSISIDADEVEEEYPRKDILFDLRTAEPYQKKLNFTKKDYLLCFAVTAIYACFALTNLGSLSAPETEFYSDTWNEKVTISFENPTDIAEIWVFGGIAEGSLVFENAEGEQLSYDQEYGDMFRWTRLERDFFETDTLYLYNTSGSTLRLRELAVFAMDGSRVIPASVSENGAMLFDEPDTVPDHPSYYNGMYFDELYHARTAYEHLHGMDPYENSHPPLGKVFIMLGIAVFGMNAFGWRIVGALFGIGMLPILYAFGKRIFKKTEYALFVTVLFAFDFMHFTQTRIATIDVYAVFFILLMYYYMYQYFCMNFFVDGLRATLKPLALAGLFFGIGAASKWTCIYAGGGLAVILLISLIQRAREYRAAMRSGDESLQARVRPFKKYLLLTLLWCCVFYIVLPVAIYIASYAPYMLSEKQYGLKDVWDYQEFMFDYHSKLTASHPYESPWWQWPFTLRPMWYYWGGEDMPSGIVSTITASGSPAVWWLCTIATFAYIGKSIYRFVYRYAQKSNATPVVFAGLCANYLPWILVTRCTFIYHFFTTVPFIILCAGLLLQQAEEKKPQLAWVKWAWMGATILLFLLLYPGLSGLEIPLVYARILKYLPGGMLFYGV
ncbi:glycosyltransferase family 39 protein [Christensenellaceae bacterium OttesenSCG-928-L17]|nr:glycosyltransferase family 39 protein [Christensenellaceae bacterium OttesenSCG-928-L17]